MRLLLGSGGFSTPERQAAWRQELDGFLGSIAKVLFVPYALADYDGYLAAMKARGFDAGRELVGIHRAGSPRQAVEEAEAIYIGGGNSFRLLTELYAKGIVDPIRERVLSGALPYVGVSAGTNMACPTLKTTNDMPIVQPPSFQALGLIPFQINPHYFAGATHIQTQGGYVAYGGETRDDRIREFHEMNDAPVLGLWEGTILKVTPGKLKLSGIGGARLFHKGGTAIDFPADADLTAALSF